MDLQFYGANCISINFKGTRIIVDDNLNELGAKGVAKPDDVALYTSKVHAEPKARLVFDGPGEYEVSDISIIGIAARSHMDEENAQTGTMFKLIAGEQNLLVTGHIYPELSDKLLEDIGHVDILIVPVGGNGFTVDAVGALKIIKAIEPKVVIPTHYADGELKFQVPQQELPLVLKELAMEPRETVTKYRLKTTEVGDITQLVILERL